MNWMELKDFLPALEERIATGRAEGKGSVSIRLEHLERIVGVIQRDQRQLMQAREALDRIVDSVKHLPEDERQEAIEEAMAKEDFAAFSDASYEWGRDTLAAGKQH